VSLWHFCTCAQCTLVRFTLSIILSLPFLKVASTAFNFPYSYMCRKIHQPYLMPFTLFICPSLPTRILPSTWLALHFLPSLFKLQFSVQWRFCLGILPVNIKKWYKEKTFCKKIWSFWKSKLRNHRWIFWKSGMVSTGEHCFFHLHGVEQHVRVWKNNNRIVNFFLYVQSSIGKFC
jgi:hypothetical protein